MSGTLISCSIAVPVKKHCIAQQDWCVKFPGKTLYRCSRMFGQMAMHEQPRLSLSGTLIPCWWQVLRRVEDIETRLAGEPAGVVVVGAGYAGVELASTVAERLGRRAAVQLVSAGQKPFAFLWSIPQAMVHFIDAECEISCAVYCSGFLVVCVHRMLYMQVTILQHA